MSIVGLKPSPAAICIPWCARSPPHGICTVFSRGFTSLFRHPGADHGAAAELVAEAHRVGGDRGQHVARRHLDALHGDGIGPVHAERVDRLELVDEVVAERVLEGRAVRLDPARDEDHLLVLHVDALDGTDPLREREELRSAERLGGCQSPSSQTIGGSASSIVVQMLNTARTRSRGSQVAAVAHVDLVDLVKSCLAAWAGDVGQSRSMPMPTSASLPRSSHSRPWRTAHRRA